MSDDEVGVLRLLVAQQRRTIAIQEKLLAELKRVNESLERETVLQDEIIQRYKDVVDEYKRMDPLFGIGVRR